MRAFLDTSVLVRYLTGDPPELLDAARSIVDQGQALTITDVVVAETAFVLLSFYRVPRRELLDGMVELLRKENIAVFGLDKEVVIQALLLCRPSKRVSFADAMLWAAARSTAGAGERATVYSFDRRFPADGVDRRLG